MAVGLTPAAGLLPVKGIRLASTSAGIYAREREDLALIEFAPNATVSAVFTRNDFCAAPVMIARRHLKRRRGHRFCLINAGNANAGTGSRGVEAALATCRELASLAGCETESILPFSTGVIGQDLPVTRITSALPGLLDRLAENNWTQCAGAIITTDTVTKGISKQVRLGGKKATITGIAKGSGMIRPDMATMLAFIGTDAAVDKKLLDRILDHAVASSFNRICVDGDMSTNDACVLMATGKAGNKIISDRQDENSRVLQDAVNEVCAYLATAIVRDGEGATKFITIQVEQGKTRRECLAVAYAVATSPLVKTALFASDPNWGRVLAAVGRAGLAGLDVNGVYIYINDCRIVAGGCRDPGYTEDAGRRVMKGADLLLRIMLARGKHRETVWTCDLSHEYVRINAEYRS
jgi:glutamate N-acetyltransferase/amino-acid N-acetyltransferase